MNKERLIKTDKFIKKEIMKIVSNKDNDYRTATYRIEHSYRVANIGAKIAREEGLAEERTFIACLLHDVGYAIEFKEKEDYKNHGRWGAKIARPFLVELGYTQEEVEEMCYGIAIHVDDVADFEGKRTPLALTVSDADNIDRFDAYRLYETLHYKDYKNLDINDQKIWVEHYLSHLNYLRGLPCGTKTATNMWIEKIDYQIEFYKKLLSQIENSNEYIG